MKHVEFEKDKMYCESGFGVPTLGNENGLTITNSDVSIIEKNPDIGSQLMYLFNKYANISQAPTHEAVINIIFELLDSHYSKNDNLDRIKTMIKDAMILKFNIDNDSGSVSDGYHTFNELYHHRAILFATLCNTYPMDSWKSKQHHDPEQPMYEGMFIVGINTPRGQATYHYDIDPYWNIFNVKELERAPEYDGHTPTDAINRIGLYAGIDLFTDDTPV